MFNFIKKSLSKIYHSITSQLSSLFTQKKIDEQTLQELKKILLSADAGIPITKAIIEQLEEKYRAGQLADGADLKKELEKLLLSTLEKLDTPDIDQKIFILVGINGSGKTTTAAKLAYRLKSEGKKVLLIAADTFRAAATEQLAAWAKKHDFAISSGQEGQDPAAVVFQGCERYKQEQFDAIIIDTAGRLHTKVNLMHELAKIKRVVGKQLPDQKIITLLTIDGMLGQNSFEQAKLFKESTDLDGIILTKMDGTGKGGILFAITKEIAIPIWYLTYGESISQIKPFDKQEYVSNLCA